MKWFDKNIDIKIWQQLNNNLLTSQYLVKFPGKIIGQLQESINQKDQTSIPSNQVIIYNRIPKTGSTSFMGVAYDLCKNNGFHVLHINVTGNNHALTFANQVRDLTLTTCLIINEFIKQRLVLHNYLIQNNNIYIIFKSSLVH